MNISNKVIQNLGIQLTNKTIDEAFSLAERDELREQLQEAHGQLEKINKVLQSDEKLKELFDEIAEKLEKE
jgi:hypothetical protein